ncbi:MAG: alpha-1,4-glucan--maltose-1-phosphate maltosyltransferase [Gemmataceae bacterium]
MGAADGRARVIIENVKPEIDGGAFPIKRVVGEKVVVEADIFGDGHDAIVCHLLYREQGEERWNAPIPMRSLGNDRWQGEFRITRTGFCHYTVRAWVDHFQTWRHDLRKRLQAQQDVSVELLIGAELVEEASHRGHGLDSEKLKQCAALLRGKSSMEERIRQAFDEELNQLMLRHPDQRFATTHGKELQVVVDREKARYSAWYELFPRSCALEPGKHGTFRDVEARLPYVRDLGFDVLYLPPIHPIGTTFRKGKNNAVQAGPNDPGSPWAIGGKAGGHKAIHPELGTLDDFRRLVARAQDMGIEIALDIAFQCTPDHPYVTEHPEWFRKRPDGTIQYAENPPKKYQDIYPLDFECDNWKELWQELKSIFEYWIAQGVRIFRVDNPHTKPFSFWEWVIAEIKKQHPDVLFLSEAFTRPRVMYRLAKLGFTQSYTYFAWRNTKWELTQYFTELTQTEVREFFRPNLWPNTPDILTQYLQYGGRPAFMTRLVLAATLGASYGIYGPAFELCIGTPREQGSEEYLDSEKYEIRHWNLDDPDSLRDFIARVNRIRRENPALHGNQSLRFHAIDNEQLLCYSKQTDDYSNLILVVVNLDPYHNQAGWIHLPIEELKLDSQQPYQVHDLLSDARYLWHGAHNFVELNPHIVPAHIFRIRRRLRTERDFEYYL